MTEFGTAFRPLATSNALDLVRSRHPLPVEIAGRSSVEAEALTHVLENIRDIDIERTAALIRNSELEGVLVALKGNCETAVREVLLEIIRRRAKARLFHLNGLMLQQDWNHANLLQSMQVLCAFMREKYPEDFEQSLFSRIDITHGELLEQILKELQAEGGTIRDFCTKYGIGFDSPMGQELCLRFFSVCGKKDYRNNRDVLAGIISGRDPEVLTPLVLHYLEVFDPVEFIDAVNLLICDRFGEPSAGHALWEQASIEVKLKFELWVKTWVVREHFASYLRKYLIWRKYHKHFEEVYRNRKLNLLLIDLGALVAVDFGADRDEAYLYRKQSFEAIYGNVKEMAGNRDMIPVFPENAVEARQAILEEIWPEVYKVSYDGVGILYIGETISRELNRPK